ncbi:Coenzyme F420 hydrogenase/dehydrogenase, beta subunit C-terminal domain [Butyrivibrio sp. NC3005]|uniref:Coenzyme F420 hydrogenase/dehydrogenase, beta subunit C-terminal domain n=1 Tax=Butyrivibrio sp. NC3005 TaxID=1280685 RepID=UPI0004001BDD|nr:Coenzyme F420 hydrogenase/dehydrogenase, beta subunit C-terminal domain [Butyrivibrio sp. NC3005]
MNNVCANWDEKCSGCGICESACPTGAISIHLKNGFFRPKVDETCVECGKCLRICPGNLNNDVISYQSFKYRIYGHSNSTVVRKEAASGAITTELLKYMLDNDVVDYVITAGIYQNDKDLGYSLIDKKNSSLLYNHSGSNYCPANIGRSIKEIKQNEGRYVIVCLPCLSRGISKLLKEDQVLNSRIKYVITLMCNHVPSYEATDYLLEKYKIKNPKMIKYRGNGWFGNFRAYDDIENGTEIFSVPFSEYFSTKYSEYFWQKACVNCIDHFGINSDACMGDADFVKYHSDSENDGETMVFSNNQEIITMIEAMESKGLISVFRDIEASDLEWIYGPLAKENRACELNTRSGARKILHEEMIERRIRQFKTFLCLPKRLLMRMIRSR